MKKKSTNAEKIIHNPILDYLSENKIFKIYNKFQKSININNKFAVAVSGGPDSLSAFLAKCYAIKNKLDVKFYIVNHNLRNNSLKEAKLVSSNLKKFSINCKILNWNGKKPLSNIQAVARGKRFYLLTNQCKKDNINKILLGHHVDDLFENFLIRLLRGSGLKGLTTFGINSDLKENNIYILRPLIVFEKKDLIYLSKKVFKFFIKDPSNLNKNFKRIRIRKLIDTLSQEGLDKKKLRLTINNLEDSNNSINFYVKKNIKNNAKYLKNNDSYILNKLFFDQPNEIIFRSLSDLIKLIGNNYYAPRGKSILNLVNMIKNDKIYKKVTLGSCFIQKFNESILISREKTLNK